MISQDTINALQNKYQTTELNVVREYVQHLFLSYFYQQPESSSIYFKGGTALRILYKSPRFSEDLDFSSSIQDNKLIEQTVLNTMHEIERENINTNIIEAKQTSGGYLSILEFLIYDSQVSIRLDISKRDGSKEGQITTIVNDFIPSYTLIQMPIDLLSNEKINALLTRKKARDFYDLYFMLRANLLTNQQKNLLTQVEETLNASDINFEKELKEFLPKSHWAIIRDFSKTLKNEIQKF